MKTLVLIPCYNEQETIVNVIDRLHRMAPEVDYLIINDCSTDESERILRENDFSYLNLPINLGIGGGVQSGYLYAKNHGYDITVQMDGDGQHDPAYLAAVIEPVATGTASMCIGSRFITKEGFQTSFMRRLGIQIISTLIFALTGKRIKDTTSGFRACNKELTAFYADYYAQDYPEPEAIIAALMNGYTIDEVPVIMEERKAGVSSINTLRSAYYMIKVSLSLIIYRLTFSHKRRG